MHCSSEMCDPQFVRCLFDELQPCLLAAAACPHARTWLLHQFRPGRLDSELLNINSAPQKLSSRIAGRVLFRHTEGLYSSLPIARGGTFWDPIM